MVWMSTSSEPRERVLKLKREHGVLAQTLSDLEFGALYYNYIDINILLISGLIPHNLPNGFAYFLFAVNTLNTKQLTATDN